MFIFNSLAAGSPSSSASDELPTADSSVRGWPLSLTSKAHFQFLRQIIMKLSELLQLLLLVLLQVPRSLLVKVNVYV